jgi:hypothetical protein
VPAELASELASFAGPGCFTRLGIVGIAAIRESGAPPAPTASGSPAAPAAMPVSHEALSVHRPLAIDDWAFTQPATKHPRSNVDLGNSLPPHNGIRVGPHHALLRSDPAAVIEAQAQMCASRPQTSVGRHPRIKRDRFEFLKPVELRVHENVVRRRWRRAISSVIAVPPWRSFEVVQPEAVGR